MVKLKNPAIHGEFILLTVINGRKVGPNPINIRDVIVEFAKRQPRQMPDIIRRLEDLTIEKAVEVETIILEEEICVDMEVLRASTR
jgi:hypothetical protein